MISFRKMLLFLFTCFFTIALGQTPELVIQRGHRGPITDIVISGDGEFILTGSPDRTLKLWEIETGKEIRTFREHSDKTAEVSVDISQDNRHAVSGSATGALKLWEMKTGNVLRILQTEGISINTVLFLPQSDLLLTGDEEGYINIWNLKTQKRIRRLVAHQGELTEMKCSTDGSLVVTGGEDGAVKIWQTKDWAVKRHFTPHTAAVTSLDFAKTNDKLISGDKNGHIFLWNIPQNRPILDFKEHTSTITCARFSPNGETVITRSKDRTVKIWEASTGIITDRQFLPFFRANDIEYSSNHKYIVGNYHSYLVIWDVEADGLVEKTVLSRDFFYKNPITDIQIGTKNGEILSIGNNAIRYWGEATGKAIQTEQELKKIAYSNDGNYIATVDDGRTIKIWDGISGNLKSELVGHLDAINSIAFSPNSKLLISAGDDKNLLCWNLKSGTVIRSYEEVENIMTNIRFSEDGQTIVGTDNQGYVLFWNTNKTKPFKRFNTQTGKIYGFAANKDLKLIATGSETGVISVWRLGTKKSLVRISAHKSMVSSLSFSPDESELLSTGEKTVKVWSLETGKLIRDLREHHEFVAKAVFSPKGNYAISASYDQSIVFWDPQIWQKLATLHLVGKEDWIIIAENGLFDASNGGMELMHYVVNDEPIGLSQLKERYFEPNLLQKIIADLSYFNLRSTKPFYQVDLYPEIELKLKEEPTPTLQIELTERSGGIGKISVFINNREIIEDVREVSPIYKSAKRFFAVNLKDYQQYLEPNTKNIIAVKAYNQGEWLSSRFKKIAYYAPEYVATRSHRTNDPNGKKIVLNRFYKPHFYGIFIGTSDYRGKDMDLSFAAKDAYDISNAFTNVAGNLYGKDNTHIKLLSSDPAHKGISPTKENIQAALQEFAEQATALDVFFIYLSGHGTNYGGENSQFYYLTKDLISGNLKDEKIREQYAISTNEFTNLIKTIPAAKQIMVIDACHSGRFAEEVYGATRTKVSNSDRRAFERMKDRTGIFILAGSAADMVSYEASQFGQGLLTYSLLLGLNGSALREGGYVDVMRLFQYAADKVPEFAQYIGGIQRPIITAPKGSNSFDIGRVNGTTRIPLAEIKPVFVRSNFQEESSYADLFNLSQLVDQRLLDISSEGESASIIFADVVNHVNAYSIKGRYRLDGDNLLIEGKLFKGDTMISPFKIKGSKLDMNTTVSMIMDAVQRALKN